MTAPDPWHDDRLAAAFAARAAMAAPVPADLASDTSVALRRRRTRRDPQWWRPLPIAAAAAVVVSIVGLSLATSWRTGAPPASTGPSAPVASGAAPSDGVTDTVLGLPVIDVPAAIAIRDAGDDDRELAVRGWYAQIDLVACPTLDGSWRDPWCPGRELILMSEPERLPSIGAVPTADVIRIDLVGLDISALPVKPDDGLVEPVEFVVVGHFDDRRSSACPPEAQPSCRDRLVVDRIDTIAGESQSLSHVDMLNDETPQSTLASVLAALASVAPDAVVLSVITAGNAYVGRIEPTLAVDPAESGNGASVILSIRWVIRTLEEGRPQTYVVTDGTDEVWRMDIDGNLFRVADPGATPPPSEGPWPPEGTRFTVPLTRNVGDRPPFEVAIVDRADRLVSAREALEDDPFVAVPDDGTSAWVTAEPGDGRSIRLGWFGGNCDHHTIVTISSSSIVVDPNVAEACNVTGIDRSLILTYSGTIDAANVVASYQPSRFGSPEVVVSPTPTDDPWPPTDARVIEVIGTVPGQSRARVVLIDDSGRVTSARSATPADGSFNPTAPFRRLDPEDPSSPYRLDWLGTSCDLDIPIKVNADLSGISIVLDPVACDGPPVERSIVLEIQGVVDTTGVEVSYPVGILD